MSLAELQNHVRDETPMFHLDVYSCFDVQFISFFSGQAVFYHDIHISRKPLARHVI